MKKESELQRDEAADRWASTFRALDPPPEAVERLMSRSLEVSDRDRPAVRAWLWVVACLVVAALVLPRLPGRNAVPLSVESTPSGFEITNRGGLVVVTRGDQTFALISGGGQ